MDVRLLDEMTGAPVPPSPKSSREQSDERMWAELGEDSGDSPNSPRRPNKGSARARARKSEKAESIYESKAAPNIDKHSWGAFAREENDDDYLAFDEEGDTEATEEPLQVSDLDVFYTQVYTFFKEKGLACMITSRLVNLVNLGFTIFFSTFLFLFVDWGHLVVCGELENGCGNFSDYVDWGFESSAFSFWQGVVVFYFVTFCLFWLWTLFSFFPVLKVAFDMQKFYSERLRISTRQLQTMHWNDVVERLIALHKRQRIQVSKKEITAHDIACHIMRRENYLIAMYNQQIFNLRVPGVYQIKNHLYRQAHRAAGIARRKAVAYGWNVGETDVDYSSEFESPADTVEAEINIPHTRGFFLTNHLQWNIEFCVLNYMFDRKKQLETNFIHAPGKLQQRFVLVGIANFVLMPFTLIFMIVYFFMRHAEALHNNKEYLGPREWSPHAKWLFREFNELPHFFEERMNRSYESADKYDKQFETPLLSILARCLSYIAGGIVALLAILALIDDNILLQVTFLDRNLLWYTALFGGLLAISRSFISEREKSVLDPNAAMRSLVKHTHYMDEKWRGKCHTFDVRDSFLQLYRFKLELFFMELVSVVVSPLILCFSLPGSAHKIVNFIETFSVDVGKGTGHVLGYSLFDFARFGDAKYGAPQNGPKDVQLDQGKLEKSFLSFKQNHATWEPDAMGKRIIKTLNRFRSEALGVTPEEETDSSSAGSASASGYSGMRDSYAQGGKDTARKTRPDLEAGHGSSRKQRDVGKSIFYVKQAEPESGEMVPADKQPNAFYWLDKFNESRMQHNYALQRWRSADSSMTSQSSASSASVSAHSSFQAPHHAAVQPNMGDGMHTYEPPVGFRQQHFNDPLEPQHHNAHHFAEYPAQPPHAVTMGHFEDPEPSDRRHVDVSPAQVNDHGDLRSLAAVNLSQEFRRGGDHEGAVEDVDLDLPEEFV